MTETLAMNHPNPKEPGPDKRFSWAFLRRKGACLEAVPDFGKLIGRIILIMLTSVILVSNARLSIPGNELQDESHTPIMANLAIDPIPLLEEPARLTCQVTSAVDAPGTRLSLELPSDSELLDGTLEWQGDLQAGQLFTLTATIAFHASGDKSIYCRASHPVSEAESWGDLAALYLSVGEITSQPGFAREAAGKRDYLGEMLTPGNGWMIDHSQSYPAPLDQRTLDAPPAVEPASEPRALTAGQSPEGTLTITGIWRFHNRSGLQASEQMIVEIVRGDNNAHLAWCYTSVTGAYSCGPFTNPGAAGVRSRFLTYTNFSPYGDVLAVVNPDIGTVGNTTNAFGTTTNIGVFADGVGDFGAWTVQATDNNLRAYWIQQDLVRGWKFIWDGTGAAQNPQETAGPATVEWKIDSTHGTHYHPGGNIHLKGEDPLSNTVVNHEYAHAIMWRIYGNTFPITYCPSPHYMNLDSHVNCAWTEGWANFFTIAVNNDPVYRWASGSFISLEAPTWGSGGWDQGDDVEGRVAGALWDILDSANDGTDTFSDGNISNIWQTIYDQNDNNFREYWTAWLGYGHNYPNAVMSIYQNTIDYRNPVPGITSLSPSSATAGGSNFTLSVYGSGFVPNQSTVRWNGSNRTTTYISSTELQANILASDTAFGSTVSVTVYNSNPGGGSSTSKLFTVNNPAPTISSLSPSSATAGDPGFTLTVFGAGFVNGASTIRWNGSDQATTFVSSAELTASIPATEIATASTASVTVNTNSPGGGLSNSKNFTINPLGNPLPTINSLTPSSTAAGGPDFTLTVYGAGFVDGASSIHWNGSARTTTFVSSTVLTAIIPASDITTGGAASVTVFTDNPGGGISTAKPFTISNAAPIPFFDGFETSNLSQYWEIYTSNEGRVQVSTSYPYQGDYSLLLDDHTGDGATSVSAAILHLNLSGKPPVILTFWWREFSDENHAQDGVFIRSHSGENWCQVMSFNDGPSTYTQSAIDLQIAANSCGKALSTDFQVMFQFYDNYPIDDDGYAIDDVSVSESKLVFLPLVRK